MYFNLFLCHILKRQYSFQNFFGAPIELIKNKPPWHTDPLLPLSPPLYGPAHRTP